ncbi:MAG: flagellar hook assembly protein FlgD [Rhodospirillales bacterium]|nr:flagellar hook assembly protein FlgD [Rhodospirillales bacterium]
MLLSGINSGQAVDPNAQAASDQAQLNDDLNQFLNLLVTQLKNQDPLDPMDSSEFTSQLVQYASVEQQIYQNAHLEKLIGLEETAQVASMVDYLGTTIQANGNTFFLEDGKAKFSYAMAENSKETLITIVDEDGETVFTGPGSNDAGYHEFEWDGKDSDGIQLEDGIYGVKVTAVDAFKASIGVSQTVYGRVTGAGAENGDVVLYLGDSIAVPLDAVLSVNETKAATP